MFKHIFYQTVLLLSVQQKKRKEFQEQEVSRVFANVLSQPRLMKMQQMEFLERTVPKVFLVQGKLIFNAQTLKIKSAAQLSLFFTNKT